MSRQIFHYCEVTDGLSLLYYLVALGLTTIAFVLFEEGGLALAAGLILGALWRISDRVSRMEARLGIHEPAASDDSGYKAELRRIRQLLDEPESPEE